MLSKQLCVHFGGALTIVAVMTWLQLRLYGVLFIIAIAIWSYKTCCPGIQIIAPENLKIKMESVCNQLITLRREKPGAFCAIASGFLIVLAILGHMISGQWIVLIGLMVAGFISTRNQFKIVNVPREDKIWSSQTTDHENDEFLPETNESDLFVLKRAGEEAELTTPIQLNDEEPEIPVDFLVSPESIPEIGESSSSDEDEAAILLNREIKFKTGYFNKDSSSDDDSITKGLSFKDYSVVDGKAAVAASTAEHSSLLKENSSNIYPKLVDLVPWNLVGNIISSQLKSDENVIKKKSLQKRNSQDSSDSEYEMINTDELNINS